MIKSISTKLFLALLSLTTLVLVATLLLARWSFDYGFLDYLNAQEQTRLNNMASDLSVYYENNGFQWAEFSVREYQEIHRKWFPPRRGKGRNERDGPPDVPPPLPGDLRPPSDDIVGFDAEADRLGERGRRRSQSRKARRFNGSVVVYDSNGNFLAGNKEAVETIKEGVNKKETAKEEVKRTKEILSAPIIYKQRKIGEIQSPKKTKFDLGVESSFSKQQTKASFIIAILSLFIAGLASWWLARMLLAPTYKMTDAIGGLVKGDFTGRLDVSRDDELGKLMLDINHLSETLQENRLSRKRWLADISHELRTPVAILSGELEAVLDGIRPLNQQAIESLNHEVIRLKHLIDDLYQLSLSDIGGLRYEFNPVNIGQLIEVVVGQQKIRITDADLKLDIDLNNDVIVDADASRLEQLFTNLLNNSIAYTDAPGKLLITLKGKGDYAVIRFIDSAPGVETNQLKEIFEPLYREDSSRNRRKAGAGLGLTISKNIVQGHQGAIDVAGSDLGGLVFTITLPIKRT